MRRPFAALVLVAALCAAPPHSPAEHVGLYFDTNATICQAPITSFGTQRVYIAAYLPVDTLIGGVLFSLQLPTQVSIVPGTVEVSRLVFEVEGDLERLRDVDFTFDLCRDEVGPFVLAQFDVFEAASPARSDLRMHLIGAAIDSLAGVTPRFKVCDPGNPKEYLGFIDRAGVDAILNCTQGCDCPLAVVRQTWSAIKTLYREP